MASFKCRKAWVRVAGAKRFQKSGPCRGKCLQVAEAIAEAAASMSGVDGYVADVRDGRNRAVGMAKTVSGNAAYDNSRNNTLAKSVDAGRGL